jgi:8-oxo-dGTP diphosphatase
MVRWICNAEEKREIKMKKEINVVGAAIINDQNQVLATERGDDRTLGTQWEFPGGKVQDGETPQQALKREIQEEFSDQAVVGAAVGPAIDHHYDFGIVHLTVYYVRLLTNNLRLVAHGKAFWCDQAQLTKLNWAAADQEIARIIEATDLTKLD